MAAHCHHPREPALIIVQQESWLCIRINKALGEGTSLVKIDVIVPVHPDDRPLLGMSFQGRQFADATLPFGLRSAPKIFNALADAMLWIMKACGIAYLMH